MKRVLLSYFIISLTTSLSFGQGTSIEAILDLPVQELGTLGKITGEQTLRISTPFAKPVFNNQKETAAIENLDITRIDLVYTQYRYSTSFNQRALNRNRLKNLKAVAPQLFKKDKIKWQLIAQTDCQSREVGNRTFHGFVIHYQEKSAIIETPKDTGRFDFDIQSEEIREREISFIDSIASELAKTTEKDSILYFRKSKWDDKKGYVPDSSTAVYASDKKLPRIPRLQTKDTTVMKVFERNLNWNNALVVTDVTGSMTPYIAQIMLWHEIHKGEEKVESYVFFNDGDGKKEFRKHVNRTGGIYIANADTLNDLSKLIKTAMRNGFGGTLPENDLEAILKGLDNSPKVDEIILLADNVSTVRDYVLLPKITKPVHVILCGAVSDVNVQYLNIAKATGGTVHTVFQDFYDLPAMKKGDELLIGTSKYLLETEEKFKHLHERQY